MDLKSLRTDKKLRDEGVWVPFPGCDIEEAALKLRSEDYAPYRRALTRIVEETQSYGRFSRRNNQMRLGDPIRFETERGRAIAKHLLLDWRGMTDNGAEVAFSPQKAEQLLTSDDFRAFYEAVDEALTALRTHKEEWEEDRKNDSESDSTPT